MAIIGGIDHVPLKQHIKKIEKFDADEVNAALKSHWHKLQSFGIAS